MRPLGREPDVGVGRVGPAVGDVRPDRVVEEHGRLLDERDRLPQRRQVERPQVGAVHAHAAARRVVEAAEEQAERGLAAARRADDRDVPPARDRERDVPEHRRAGLVGERHVAELERAEVRREAAVASRHPAAAERGELGLELLVRREAVGEVAQREVHLVQDRQEPHEQQHERDHPRGAARRARREPDAQEDDPEHDQRARRVVHGRHQGVDRVQPEVALRHVAVAGLEPGHLLALAPEHVDAAEEGHQLREVVDDLDPGLDAPGPGRVHPAEEPHEGEREHRQHDDHQHDEPRRDQRHHRDERRGHDRGLRQGHQLGHELAHAVRLGVQVVLEVAVRVPGCQLERSLDERAVQARADHIGRAHRDQELEVAHRVEERLAPGDAPDDQDAEDQELGRDREPVQPQLERARAGQREREGLGAPLEDALQERQQHDDADALERGGRRGGDHRSGRERRPGPPGGEEPTGLGDAASDHRASGTTRRSRPPRLTARDAIPAPRAGSACRR